MEYEQKLVSLYGKDVLPKLFIVLEKSPNGVSVIVKSQRRIWGTLFVYQNEKIIKKSKVYSMRKLFMPKTFNFGDAFLFVFYQEDEAMVGECGKVNEKERVLINIQQLYEKLKKEMEEFSFDKEYITENILQKLFNNRHDCFFEQINKHLQNIFSLLEKSEVLEKNIKNSRVVCMRKKQHDIYVAIVYQNSKPYAVGIGFDDISMMSKNNNSYQIFCVSNNKDKNKFVCFSFRSAFDGENIWLK